MNRETREISESISMLRQNLTKIARVEEWAYLMGYPNPKRFSRKFLRYYSVRPVQILKYIRLKSISLQLRKKNKSNFEIARRHSIPDEKALNKFTNYHIGFSPSELRLMPEALLEQELEKLGSKIG